MIKRLLTLNGLAIIAAVVHHSTDWVVTALIWWADRYEQVTVPALEKVGGFDYFVLRSIDQLAFFAVPAFLFVSGFFVAIATKADQKTVAFNIVLQRVKYLLPPYLIWSVVITAFNIVLGQSYTFIQFARAMVTGGVTGPFYYVPLLIVLYLISPLLVPLAKNRWKLLLGATVALAMMSTFLRYEHLLSLNLPGSEWIYSRVRNSHFMANSLWFSIGMIGGFHRQGFSDWLKRNRRPLLFVMLATYIFGIIEWNWVREVAGLTWLAPQTTFIDQVFGFSLILCWLAFERITLKSSSWVNLVGKKSYGIYLVHVPVIVLSAKGLYHLWPWLLSQTLLFQAVIVAAGLSIPLLIMEIVEHSPLRPIYKYLFG